MRKINDFDRKIIRHSLYVALGIVIIIVTLCLIFKWPLTYVLGFILSYGVNIITFLKSNSYIDKILNREDENPKKGGVLNSFTNNLMYALVLLVNLLLDCFNVFIGLIGLFVIKIVVIFEYGFKSE